MEGQLAVHLPGTDPEEPAKLTDCEILNKKPAELVCILNVLRVRRKLEEVTWKQGFLQISLVIHSFSLAALPYLDTHIHLLECPVPSFSLHDFL